MNFFARVDKLLMRVRMVGNAGNGSIDAEGNRVIVFQPSKFSSIRAVNVAGTRGTHDLLQCK